MLQGFGEPQRKPEAVSLPKEGLAAGPIGLPRLNLKVPGPPGGLTRPLSLSRKMREKRQDPGEDQPLSERPGRGPG